MTATEIKAELYALQSHVCTKPTHVNEKGEPWCASCRRVEGLQKRLQEFAEAELRAVIQFALDKCACRSAGNMGNMHSPFAYLWKDDWDEFERMANEAGVVKSEERARHPEAIPDGDFVPAAGRNSRGEMVDQ